MSDEDRIGMEREQLGFTEAVRRQFAFLAGLGFSEIEALPTIVRFRRSDVDVDVYHGRQSYEISLQIGAGDQQFSMEQIIHVADPAAWEEYRVYAATTPQGVKTGVERLADLLRRYGERALEGDPEFFANLRRQQSVWAEALALDVRARQIRPKAAAAFREGRYREAAEFYEQIAARLSPAEKAKLAAARKRS